MTWARRVLIILACGLLLLSASFRDGSAAPIDVTVTIPGPSGPGTGSAEVTNAQFRWGLNNETGSGAFFGGCNFLSAGTAGNAGGSRLWTDADNGTLFRSTDGQVRIEKPTGTSYREMAWADRCAGSDGAPVTTSQMSGTGVQVVIDGGTGWIDRTAGTAQISWRGAFTIVHYGGLSYWWVTDPVLTVRADGTGVLTGTGGGFGSDRDDTSRWIQLAPTPIVLANLAGIEVGEGGFATDPLYRGVAVSVPTGSAPQVREGTSWGAFPQSFVDFQDATGQSGYWYSTGGLRDPAKVATTLYISYDARTPIRNDGNAPATPGSSTDTIPDLTGSTGGTASTTDAGITSTGATTPGGQSLASGGVPSTGGVGDPVLTSVAPAGNIVPLGANTVLPNLGIGPTARTAAGQWLPWSISLLLVLVSVSWIGFRKGWLQLPFRKPKPRP